MHEMVVAAVVAVLVAHVGIHDATAFTDTPTPRLQEFPSPYLQKNTMLPLMKTHLELSLSQLLTSKQYGGQYVQRPGLAKLLAQESDRHWEEGLNVLKKYLQIGGNVDDNFKNQFNFEGNGELDMNSQMALSQMNMKYLDTMKNLMGKSRELVKTLTDYHHAAIQRSGVNGDVDVAHFLSEQAEKEAEMAHKMAISSTVFNSFKNSGVAIDMFDQHI